MKYYYVNSPLFRMLQNMSVLYRHDQSSLAEADIYYSASGLHHSKSPLIKERLRGNVKLNANNLLNSIICFLFGSTPCFMHCRQPKGSRIKFPLGKGVGGC